MVTALDDALRMACEQRQLDFTGAMLIHHYSNAVYLLPAEPAIARIAISSESPERLRATQTVISWLSRERGFAATTPLAGADLVEINPATTVTFWTYYPQPQPGTGAPLTSAHLGQLLHDLHLTGWSPTPLPRWTPLESLERALSSTVDSDAVSAEERQWIRGRVRDVRAELAVLDWPLGEGLIHGDQRKSLEVVRPASGRRSRRSATRLVTPLARSSRPRTISADESRAVLRYRFQQPGDTMQLMKPVSSSRLMKVTPDAVAGRCRWVTTPAART